MALLVETRSDSKQAQADLKKLKDSVESIQSSIENTTSKFSNFAKVIAGTFAALSAGGGLIRLSDELTNIRTKIQLVTDSQEEFNKSLKDVKSIAISTRSDLSSIASLYSKVARSSKELGIGQADVVKFTRLVSQSVATSGGSLQETNAAIMQLGQALASGRLAGDELRSILENAPPLANEIAKGLNVSIGKLRELGEQGQLSASKVFQAVIKRQADIEKQFGKVNITFASAIGNLKTSFSILFDEIKVSLLGSSNSFSKFINNIAVNIFELSSNIDFLFLKLKLEFKSFALATLIGLYNLQDEFLKLKDIVGNSFEKLFSNLLPLLGAAIVFINTIFTNVKNNLINIFEKLYIKLPKIDVNNIFPSLESALNTVKSWVIKVERWFYWLYDKVIGNSWIPDLVKQTTAWLSQLTKKPLDIIKEFVTKANLQFANLKSTLPFTIALAGLLKYKGVLLSVLGIAGTLAGVLGLLSFTDSKGITKLNIDAKISEASETVSKHSNDILKKISENTKKFLDFNKILDNIRVIFGVQKTQATQVPKIEVPKYGTMDSVLDILPENLRVPVFTLIAGLFTFALTSAFNNPTVKTIVFSLATSAAAIYAARSIDPKLITESFLSGIFKVLSVLEKGISAIFSGNVLNDPFGLITLLAKTALLFKAGREYLGRVATGALTAPTTIAETTVSGIQARILERSVNNLNRSIAETNVRARADQNLRNQERINRIQTLAQMRDLNGNLVGYQRAVLAVRTRDTQAFGTQQTANLLKQINAGRQLDVQARQNTRNAITNLQQNITESTGRITELRNRLAQQGTVFRQGVVSTSAGIGGTIGGFAGFQVGVEIARGMTDAPAWQRVGVVIASSMATQAVGSGIGAAIGFGFIAALSGIGKLLSSALGLAIRGAGIVAAFLGPIAAGGVLLAAALYSGFELFKLLPESWKERIRQMDFFGFNRPNRPGGPTTTSEMGGQTTADAAKKGQAVVTSITFDEQVKKAWTDILNEGIYIALKNLSTEFEKRTGTKDAVFTYFKTNILKALQEAFEPTAIGGIYTGLKILTEKIERLFKSPSVKVEPTQILSPEENITPRSQSATPSAVVTPAPAAELKNLEEQREKLFEHSQKVLKERNEEIIKFWQLQYEIIAKTRIVPQKELDDSIRLIAHWQNVLNKVKESLDELTKRADNLSKTATLRKATGGWIRGPGTGTSDSIPAMLSNGEFVVNAKDAQKNWNILTAINSGHSIGSFSEGTIKAQEVTVANTEEVGTFFNEIIKNFKKFFESIQKILPGAVKNVEGQLIPNTETGTSPTSFSELAKAKNQADVIKDIVSFLESAKFSNIDAKALSKLTPTSIQNLAYLIDKFKEADAELSKISKERGPESFGAALAKSIQQDAAAAISKTLKESRVTFTSPSGISSITESTPFKIADILPIIKEAFPELDINEDLFKKIDDQLRKDLLDSALKINKQRKELLNKTAGSIENASDPRVLAGLTEAYEKLSTNIKNSLELATERGGKSLIDRLNKYKVPFEQFRDIFEKANINISANFFDTLDSNIQGTLISFAEVSLDFQKKMSDTNLKWPERQIIAEAFRVFNLRLNEFVESIRQGVDPNAVSKLAAELSKAQISFDKTSLNLLKDAEIERARELLNQISSINPESLPEAKRIEEQIRKSNLMEELLKILTREIPNQLKQAGKDFGNKVSQDFSYALNGLLRGQSEDDMSVMKTFLKRMLDRTTENVLDTFIKGFTSKLTASVGIEKLGESLFDLGASVFSKIGAKWSEFSSIWSKEIGTFDETLQVISNFLGTDIKTFLNSIFVSIGDIFKEGIVGVFGIIKSIFKDFRLEEFSSIFKGIFDLAKSAIKFIPSLFGLNFASGGFVSGPGTGTSDSIPAMLSNGEFVVNANATRQNFGLLNAINSGQIKKLAEGGLVNSTITQPPALTTPPASMLKESSNQIININITGDISKQTKAEIYKMLPSIADGVNYYNREKGLRV
jgi:tape measure domain-containing protein